MLLPSSGWTASSDFYCDMIKTMGRRDAFIVNIFYYVFIKKFLFLMNNLLDFVTDLDMFC